MVVSTILGAIPFLLIFGMLFLWSYMIFQKNIIPMYSTSSRIPKSQINKFIDRELNRRFQVNLREVLMEEDEEQAADFDGKPNFTQVEGSSDKLVGVIFSGTMSLSIELIVLMMCELMGIFQQEVRLAFFKHMINLLIVSITCVQPLVVLKLLICKTNPLISGSSPSNLILIAIAFAVWLYVLHKCGDLSQSYTPDKASFDAKTLVERKINEVAIAGISSMAILSGIGSATTPFKVITERISGNSQGTLVTEEAGKNVSEAELNSLITSYNQTVRLLCKRKTELEKHIFAHGGTIYNQPNLSADNMLLHSTKLGDPTSSKFVGIIHKVQSFASLTSLSSFSNIKQDLEEVELKREIDSLDSLKESMYKDVVRKLHLYVSFKQHQHQNGRLWSRAVLVSNYIFSGYSLYRMIYVLIYKLPLQYFRHRGLTSEPHNFVEESIGDSIGDSIGSPIEDQIKNPIDDADDALAVSLAKLVTSSTSFSTYEAGVAHQISLVLSAGLFVCSFSVVSRTFLSFRRLLPSPSSYSSTTISWLKNLVVAELLGVYVISTALLIRTNLPSNLSRQVSKILCLSGLSVDTGSVTSANEVRFIDNWFDKVFGLSSFLTLIVLVIRMVFNGLALNDVYDEENFLEDLSVRKLA